MGLLRRHRLFVWYGAVALLAMAVGGVFIARYWQSVTAADDRMTTATELEILDARTTALALLTQERIVALDLAYREGTSTYAPSASRAVAVDELIGLLDRVTAEAGPLAASAGDLSFVLGSLVDPATSGLSDAARFDAYLEYDDVLCCLPVTRNDGSVSTRVQILDEVLWELTIDAARFERILGGWAIRDARTDGPASSLEAWLDFDIEMAEDAPASFIGEPNGPRRVLTTNTAIVGGIDAINELDTEKLLRSTEAWVTTGGPVRGDRPPAGLEEVAAAAGRTVTASHEWLSSIISDEIETVSAEAGDLRRQAFVSLATAIVFLVLAVAAAWFALRRIRRSRAASLRKRREAARQLRFLANVSHEIRSPLTAISGFVDMLRGDYDSLSDEEVQEYLEIVGDQTRQLAALVEDVLTVSKLEADQLSLEVTDVSLRSVVQSVVDVVFADTASRVTIDVDHGAMVRADELRLSQVIRNLAENAVKYGGSGVVIRSIDLGRHHRVEVVDDGPGVSEADRERIFRRFAQTDGASGSGFGLGLSIAVDLVEAMGGHMGFDPVEPTGACFWFTVPAIDPLATAA